MKIFHAQLLFDGQQWLKSKYFQVDPNGIFHDLPTTTVMKEQCEELGIVIPGFINCHSHSFQRAMAGLGEKRSADQKQDSFWTWRDKMYQLVQTLDPESFKTIADWLYVEMLESGYTSVGEFHYLHKKPNGHAYNTPIEMALQLLYAGVQTGIRICLLPVLYQQGGFGVPLQPKQHPFGMASLEEYTQYHHSLHSHIPNGFQLGVAAHSIRAIDKHTLQEFTNIYNNKNIPIHIHIAEQPAEVADAIKFYGKRPVELLIDNVEVNKNWSLIHATHINSEELKGILNAGATVGICPLTEANLGDGIFPMRAYLEQGGKIAIGSDSHIRIDPFEELRLIEYSQRYQDNERACLANTDFLSPGLRLAYECYLGGKQSLKLNIGSLHEGHYADFIVLREDHPATLRLDTNTLWDELIFAGGREVVKDVYTGGIKIVSQGQHILHDEKLSSLAELYHSL
ncbi:formimidoylglutamate deiminase [Spartinivicinus ruber]|uniref:formimidoylglutamate deiminase n=1 Tax=Spartinivicinus ruber TaxID=2683272 RepID=UPI0013D57AD8|nr:formimidoylglutamate deiminase [Spartinivicinus ruber]